MSEVVLDASALLAVLFAEPGQERVRAALVEGALLSTVNLAEVVTKLCERLPAEAAWEAIDAILPPTVELSPAQARAVGELRPRTRAAGLSLGGRACLAVAMERGLPALTMDRHWAALDIGVAIEIGR